MMRHVRNGYGLYPNASQERFALSDIDISNWTSGHYGMEVLKSIHQVKSIC